MMKRDKDQGNRIVHLERESHVSGQLIFQKAAKEIQRRNDTLLKKDTLP